MGLFTKKDPCAICGGKVKAIFPWKVEGQLICNSCYGNVDLPKELSDNMTMDLFREYSAFRDENAQLKEQFQTTQEVKFGFLDDHIAFDMNNGLFCMNSNLNSTIFEAKCIKSFTIREDNAPLFEGSAAGLVCYTSTVPDRVAAMTPMLRQVAMMNQMKELAEEAGRIENSHRYNRDIAEPFRQFVVEIHCDHPYWKVIKADKNGPTFSDTDPDEMAYLRDYENGVEIMTQLARALMQVAFPGAPEQRLPQNAAVIIGQPFAGAAPAAVAPAAPVDVVAEIQKFKALEEQGIITEEEFAAKKRQLLGI